MRNANEHAQNIAMQESSKYPTKWPLRGGFHTFQRQGYLEDVEVSLEQEQHVWGGATSEEK
jgi:hypothetical protein